MIARLARALQALQSDKSVQCVRNPAPIENRVAAVQQCIVISQRTAKYGQDALLDTTPQNFWKPLKIRGECIAIEILQISRCTRTDWHHREQHSWVIGVQRS